MLTKPAIGKLNNVFFGNTKKCDLNDNKCKIRFYYLTIKEENRQTNLQIDN